MHPVAHEESGGSQSPSLRTQHPILAQRMRDGDKRKGNKTDHDARTSNKGAEQQRESR